MTYKTIDRLTVDGAKEIEVAIDNLENTKDLLIKTGLKGVTFQENYREIWEVKKCTLTIDSWPMIDPILEIESDNEENVWIVLTLMGYDKKDCMFGNIRDVYKTYGIELHEIETLSFNSNVS